MEYLNLPPREVDPDRGCFDETLGRARGRQRLQGLRAVVVGAGQRPNGHRDAPVGIGRAISQLIAREGASVACLDISREAANATVSAIEAEGFDAFAAYVDVSDAPTIDLALDASIDRLEGLDILVLNVGTSSGASLKEMTVEAWDRDMSINLRSHMLFARAALERMNPGASIVLISSAAAMLPDMGQPAYEASKAGQLALVRSIAKAGEPKAIRCNAVLPGLIDTPMGRDEAARRPRRGAVVPFGRQGTAWEVAYAVVFLSSREATFVNAQSLIVDGGQSFGIMRRKAPSS